MPPKKRMKLKGQTTLSFGARSVSDQPHETDIPEPINGEEVDKKQKRAFQDRWLKLYPWLAYEDGRGMSCTSCMSAGRRNTFTDGCTNYRTSSLNDHMKTSDHQASLIAPQLQTQFQEAKKKCHSDQEKGAVIGLKAAYWLTKEGIPLLKFKSLIEFLQELKVPDICYLKASDGVNYTSSYAATEFLEAISDTIDQQVTTSLQKSPAVSVLADESTDICVEKRLCIYMQLLDPVTMIPSTRFLTNIHLQEGTGRAIADTIWLELEKRGIDSGKVMGLGSDGAAVMTGCGRGVNGMMKRINPHMINVHCVAHRLALCTSQAAEKLPALKDYQEVVTSIYYYFKYSPNKISRMSEVQKILDSPQLRYKEVHSIRWLSFYNALETVYRTLEPLLAYLADVSLSDAKAIGLKKKLQFDSVCI